MEKKITILAVLLLFCLSMASLGQNVIYVKSAGTGNGSSWENSMGNLQAAVDSAATLNPKPAIWVAAGVFYGDSIADNYAFNAKNGVNVYGGFAGNEPADYDLSLRNLGKNLTILDGQNVQSVLRINNSSSDSITWDGFTIRNGQSESAAGVYLRHNSKLSNCVIHNNSITTPNMVGGHGGGICALNSTIISCDIHHNSITNFDTTGSYGGAIYADNSTIIDCEIHHNNIINDDSQCLGGGIYANNSTIINCDVFDNNITDDSTASNGGGIYASECFILDCDIHHNSTRSDGSSDGGGAYILSSTMKNSNVYANDVFGAGSAAYGGGTYAYISVIENCAFYGNHSDNTAGGLLATKTAVRYCDIFNNNSNFDGGGATFQMSTVANCGIHSNEASRYGGGIELYSSSLYNCHIGNNTNNGATPYGSGVYASMSPYNNPDSLPSKLINCNVVNNYASGITAAVYNESSRVNILINSIIWGNRDSGTSQQMGGTEADVRYCAIEGGFAGDNNIDLETENYGNNSSLHYVHFLNPTAFTGAGYSDGNWVLQPGSACIDSGTPDTTGLLLPATDVWGFDRIYNNRIDRGAHEYFPRTGIDETENLTILQIFPNPATTQITLQTATNDNITAVEIYDMVGRLAATNSGTATMKAPLLFNVSSLPTGTYFVRATLNGNQVVTNKLVITR